LIGLLVVGAVAAIVVAPIWYIWVGITLVRTRTDNSTAKRKLSRDGVEEILNLRPKSRKAKIYQVKQVPAVILKYKLEA
jgi:hypothetical protein